jgi:glycosyltransferase involved in cell wall biosynthesis
VIAARVKPLVRRAVQARDRRARRLPPLRTGPQDGPPTVYYLTPDYDVPAGGIRGEYRHVDLLNAAGRDAAVLHHRSGFSCSWFAHGTRVTAAPDVVLGPQDVLVVPEIYGPDLRRLPRGPRLVAFNQNAYLTFAALAPGEDVSYAAFAVAMTVSQDSADYLRFAFPELEVAVVHNAIDPDLFRPAPVPAGRRIAVMPRRRREDADQVLRLLGRRLDGWEVVRIAGESEREVADALRSCSIFLAFGHQEGFGLPPAEAMASGCYVIGFPAFGGREIFDPAWSRPIADGDVLAMAHAVAETVAAFERDPEPVRRAAALGTEHVRARFGPQRQRDELLAVFAGLS